MFGGLPMEAFGVVMLRFISSGNGGEMISKLNDYMRPTIDLLVQRRKLV